MSLRNSHAETPISKVMLEDVTFLEMIMSLANSTHECHQCLYNAGQGSFSDASALSEPGNGPSPSTITAFTLVLDFPVFRTMKNKLILFTSYPIFCYSNLNGVRCHVKPKSDLPATRVLVLINLPAQEEFKTNKAEACFHQDSEEEGPIMKYVREAQETITDKRHGRTRRERDSGSHDRSLG